MYSQPRVRFITPRDVGARPKSAISTPILEWWYGFTTTRIDMHINTLPNASVAYGERALLMAVITRAILDGTKLFDKSRNKLCVIEQDSDFYGMYDDAVAWLESESTEPHSFAWFADLLNLEHEQLRSMWKKRCAAEKTKMLAFRQARREQIRAAARCTPAASQETHP